MEKFVLAKDCALRCLDTQRGEKTILLIHGYLESIEVFDELVAKLKKDYRVIAIDVPGHGISSVVGECHTMEFLSDVIDEVLNQFKVEKCWIVGHSMGGYIAAHFAKNYPQRCEGLMMVHSHFSSDTPEIALHREKEIELIVSGKKDLMVSLTTGKALAKQNRKRLIEVIMNLVDQAMITEEAGIIALLRGMGKRADLNDFARNSTMPIVCLWGVYDEIFRIEQAKEIAESLPNAKHYYMENSGHMSFIEDESRFVEIVKTEIV